MWCRVWCLVECRVGRGGTEGDGEDLEKWTKGVGHGLLDDVFHLAECEERAEPTA